MHKEFWWGNLKDMDHLKDLGMWEDNIKVDLKEIRMGERGLY